MNLQQIQAFQKKYYARFKPSPPWVSMEKDHEAILWLLHSHKCKSFCEIGTWEGFTSRLVWESGIKNIHAIDIRNDKNHVDANYDEAMHRQDGPDGSARIGKYLREVGVEVEFQNSMEYVPTKQYDAVFIDANHDYAHVRSDTCLALPMAKKIVLWHDLRNGNPQIDLWMDDFKECNPTLNNWEIYPGSCVAVLKVSL